MGCDGGTIPKRHELVKGPRKVEKVRRGLRDGRGAAGRGRPGPFRAAASRTWPSRRCSVGAAPRAARGPWVRCGAGGGCRAGSCVLWRGLDIKFNKAKGRVLPGVTTAPGALRAGGGARGR